MGITQCTRKRYELNGEFLESRKERSFLPKWLNIQNTLAFLGIIPYSNTKSRMDSRDQFEHVKARLQH